MPTDRVQFSDAPITDEFGLISGSATAAQFPSRPCWKVKLKARSGNIGSFFIGDYSNRVYWELDASQETEWVSASNLNRYWFSNPSGTVDQLSWWIQK